MIDISNSYSGHAELCEGTSFVNGRSTPTRSSVMSAQMLRCQEPFQKRLTPGRHPSPPCLPPAVGALLREDHFPYPILVLCLVIPFQVWKVAFALSKTLEIPKKIEKEGRNELPTEDKPKGHHCFSQLYILERKKKNETFCVFRCRMFPVPICGPSSQ